jgi:hypothetical protein
MDPPGTKASAFFNRDLPLSQYTALGSGGEVGVKALSMAIIILHIFDGGAVTVRGK